MSEHEVPAWRRRNAAIRRALSVVLTKGLVSGGWSCCQGEAWFLSVTNRVLLFAIRRRDLDLSLPAVIILSHQSLWVRMLFCRSPLRYLTRVVREIRPTEAVVLLLNGRLPFRARWRQKSIMPEEASWSRPCIASSFCLQAVLGGSWLKAASHSSVSVMPSRVVRRAKSRSAWAVVNGWLVEVKEKNVYWSVCAEGDLGSLQSQWTTGGDLVVPSAGC